MDYISFVSYLFVENVFRQNELATLQNNKVSSDVRSNTFKSFLNAHRTLPLNTLYALHGINCVTKAETKWNRCEYIYIER